MALIEARTSATLGLEPFVAFVKRGVLAPVAIDNAFHEHEVEKAVIAAPRLRVYVVHIHLGVGIKAACEAPVAVLRSIRVGVEVRHDVSRRAARQRPVELPARDW